MNAKPFLKNYMPWFTPYNCSNSSKNNSEKTVFTFPKNECNRKAWVAALNQNEGTPVQSQRINVKSTLRKALF